MKSCVVLMVLALAAAGDALLAHGRSESGLLVARPSEDDASRPCPVKAIEDTQFTLPAIMLLKAYDCYKPSQSFIAQINQAHDAAAFREIFKNACAKMPTTRSCMDGVSSDSKVCLDATEIKMFNTVTNFALSGMELSCADDSSRLATMFGDELTGMTLTNQMRIAGCLYGIALPTSYRQETDFSAFTMRRYRAMMSFKKCYVDTAKSQDLNVDVGEGFISEVLSTMTCISSESGEPVLCEHLENNGN